MIESAIESDVQRKYSFIRQQFPHEGPLAVLHMAAETSAIAFGDLVAPDEIYVLSLGVSTISKEYLKHQPPTPYELESAIVLVEDEIARVRAVDGMHFRLFTSDAAIHDISIQAGIMDASDAVSLSIESVESLFGRLVSIAEGQPVSYAGIPTNGEFSASLVILREFMHHLHFPRITCVGSSEPRT